jgi:uncharacterized protein (DUF924 family)
VPLPYILYTRALFEATRPAEFEVSQAKATREVIARFGRHPQRDTRARLHTGGA